MHIQIEKVKEFFTGRNLRRSFFGFMSKQVRVVITLSVLFLFFYCVYLWHSYIYVPEWSEERKQEYIENKEKSVVFDKPGFEMLVSELRERQLETQKDIDIQEDIFRLEK